MSAGTMTFTGPFPISSVDDPGARGIVKPGAYGRARVSEWIKGPFARVKASTGAI